MKKFFIYIYSYAIISTFGFGQIRIPGFPFNVGQIAYILLMISCCIIDKKALYDKYLGMYAIFIFFYFLSSVFTGFDQTFISFFITKLFTLIPLYWGTKILISRFKTIKPLLIPLMFIGILDTFVTISQVYGIHIFDTLINYLGVHDEEKHEMMLRRDLTIGLSMNGIYVSAVHNGHNLLFFFCMSFALIRQKINAIRLLPTLILFIGIFFCQQRSAFLFAVMAMIAFIYILIKNKLTKAHQFTLICTIILLAIIADISIASEIFSDSRLSNIELSDRSGLFNDSIAYIFDNLFIGGIHQFTRIYGLPPHNTLISAFMAGGLIGGFILVHMMYLQFSYAYKSLKCNYSFLQYVFTVTFTALIGDSMFHNTGYVQGDYATFITWALILMSYNFIQYENYIRK